MNDTCNKLMNKVFNNKTIVSKLYNKCFGYEEIESIYNVQSDFLYVLCNNILFANISKVLLKYAGEYKIVLTLFINKSSKNIIGDIVYCINSINSRSSISFIDNVLIFIDNKQYNIDKKKNDIIKDVFDKICTYVNITIICNDIKYNSIAGKLSYNIFNILYRINSSDKEIECETCKYREEIELLIAELSGNKYNEENGKYKEECFNKTYDTDKHRKCSYVNLTKEQKDALDIVYKQMKVFDNNVLFLDEVKKLIKNNYN